MEPTQLLEHARLMGLTQHLLSFFLCLQTIEAIRMIPELAIAWPWKILKIDFPRGKELLGYLLHPPRLQVLMFLQLAIALLTFFFPNPIAFLFLLLTHVLFCLRFRGIFNGGSDYMTAIMLLGVIGAGLFPAYSKYFLAYIGVQSLLSYFVAGVVKLKEPLWRSGTALRIYLTQSAYQVPLAVRNWTEKAPLMLAASWCVILFESLSPLILFSETGMKTFFILGALFHLSNAYILGLNRFFWIWIATYPAVFSLLR